jgi:predicted amidohydrolase YtcJ
MNQKSFIQMGFIIVIIGIAFLSCSGPEPYSGSADLIFRNGAIYTMDSARSWAEALAIQDGKILYVGDDSGAEKFESTDTKVVDLEAKMVLPGFHDSHIHLVTGGIELSQCDLNGLQTKEDIFEKIRQYNSENPDKEWIVGGGWNLPIFPDANPTKEQLDQLVCDRPAYLSAADGHSVWVNSKALAIAGITEKTPDPEGGRIERVKGTNEPSGTLRESAAGLVAKYLPELSPDDYLNGLRAGLHLANSFGITSINEASADEDILEAYAEFDRRHELSVRVVASMHVDPKMGLDQIEELLTLSQKYQGNHLRTIAAKIFADGVIESHTAALLEPYLDRPGYSGLPNLEPDLFNRLATALDKEQFQIHIHAIGDRAIRMSLDALEAAQRINRARDARHHIAHLQLINPADIPRFKSLDVIANFQPLWAYPDLYITELTEPVLGPERSRWLYPIGSIVKSGAKIVGGSDWSVSSMNPLDAIQVAITRKALDDPSAPSWLPEELVDLPTILAAYTINGAFLNRQEEITGSLEVGKAADLVVLDRNLFAISPDDIHKAKVLLTILEGKEVCRDKSF